MFRRIKNNPVLRPPAEIFAWQNVAGRYIFAAAIAFLSYLLRMGLLQVGPMPHFVTFYPAVLLVAMVAGGGPGAMATLLCGLTSIFFVLPPLGQWTIASPADALALIIFLGTNLSLCALAERLRRSRWAQAFGIAKQQESQELTRKNEELARQAEELSQQSEESAQQNEELQSQSEEIQALNTELTGREDMLRKLLEAARLHHSEESVLGSICAAAKDMLGAPDSVVVICERHGSELHIRAHAGADAVPGRWPIEGAFPWLVMQEARTACLNDAALRPDLQLLHVPGAVPFQSALSTPLYVGGALFGACTVYSSQKQEWTTEQFRLVEWLATQCGHILDTLRLQEQLRHTAEQNRLLSDLLERSEQPFGIGYPNGKLGFVNEAFERLTGYSRKELEAMDWVNVLTPPEWKSLEQARLEELHRTGQPVRYEKEYARKDGTRVPIELLVHLIRDQQGNLLHYYSFITDISERKRIEQEMHRLSHQRQLALDAAKLGWWHYDPVTRMASWDARYQEIFGVNGHSRLNDEILKRLHPDDLPGVWAKVEAALNPEDPKSYSAEYRIHMPDGSMKWVEAHGIATFEGNGPERRAVSFVGTVADITEKRKAAHALRESEERFRLALRNAPVSIAVQDRDLRYVWAYNQRTARPEDIIGKLDSEIFTPAEAAHMTALKRRVLAENREHHEQMWLDRPGGRIFLDICWEPIRDESGNTIGVGSATVDLTKIKLAEEALAQAKNELEQRVAERTAELAQRAAQLRALAGELTFTEQRERLRLAKILHDHLQQLLVAAKFRLVTLSKGSADGTKEAITEIEELIDESITSSRSLTAELSPPILHEAGLAAGLEWLARRMSDKQGLCVDLKIDTAVLLPDDIKILLFESVRELLFNIVKHGRTNAASVSLERAAKILLLTVSDNGIGFDPEILPPVGESGRGFGLFSIRERLELFGGRLQIQSAPGAGTRISMTMPLPEFTIPASTPSQAGVLPEMLVSQKPAASLPGKKIRILLADDHAVVRQGMSAMLATESDFEIAGGAANGEEAIALAAQLMPDVILMDMSMPVLNGLEATRAISREYPEIRIIGLSMFEDSERAQAMRDAGAANYVMKSGPAEELKNAIRAAVRRS